MNLWERHRKGALLTPFSTSIPHPRSGRLPCSPKHSHTHGAALKLSAGPPPGLLIGYPLFPPSSSLGNAIDVEEGKAPRGIVER